MFIKKRIHAIIFFSAIIIMNTMRFDHSIYYE
ncbi:unnamed protein product [Schistosoma mattheei]|uniref:Uncharacterized protein n=1 Tax=Schistosoma mattheei TaxID=31246 RepID=A0A3P8A132_9TREM|nr:unnamed protein product [Schistosoma mattheei]